MPPSTCGHVDFILQRAHSLILKAMALTHEKANWAKLAHRYTVMHGLQKYIGET